MLAINLNAIDRLWIFVSVIWFFFWASVGSLHYLDFAVGVFAGWWFLYFGINWTPKGND